MSDVVKRFAMHSLVTRAFQGVLRRVLGAANTGRAVLHAVFAHVVHRSSRIAKHAGFEVGVIFGHDCYRHVTCFRWLQEAFSLELSPDAAAAKFRFVHTHQVTKM